MSTISTLLFTIILIVSIVIAILHVMRNESKGAIGYFPFMKYKKLSKGQMYLYSIWAIITLIFFIYNDVIVGIYKNIKYVYDNFSALIN